MAATIDTAYLAAGITKDNTGLSSTLPQSILAGYKTGSKSISVAVTPTFKDATELATALNLIVGN